MMQPHRNLSGTKGSNSSHSKKNGDLSVDHVPTTLGTLERLTRQEKDGVVVDSLTKNRDLFSETKNSAQTQASTAVAGGNGNGTSASYNNQEVPFTGYMNSHGNDEFDVSELGEEESTYLKRFGRGLKERRLLYLIALVIIVLLVTIIAIVAIVLNGGGGGGGSSSSSSAQTSPTTPSPTNPPNLRTTDAPSSGVTPNPTPTSNVLAPTTSTLPPVPFGTDLPSSDPTSFYEATASIFARSPTIDKILDRGVLRCGFLEQPGFSVFNEDAQQDEGFEADMCRAVAAGIFGDPEGRLESVYTGNDARFAILQNDTVDISAARVTFNFERDIHEESTGFGFQFSVPYLYNGLGFGGIPEHVDCMENETIIDQCISNVQVCVLSGSTHLEVLQSQYASSLSLIAAPRFTDLYGFFRDGRCNVIAAEQFDITEDPIRRNGYTGPYKLGSKAVSSAPISLATREDDPWFSDFVNWIIQGLLAAEELSVTQQTAISIGTTDNFGDRFENMFIDAVAAVGNYGEVYNRHLSSILDRQSANEINDGHSALIFSFPFGTPNKALTKSPASSPTLEAIRARGTLVCAFVEVAGFADFNSDSQEWRGFDTDFCRAIAAAIFRGQTEGRVTFQPYLTTSAAALALAKGEVDVLAATTPLSLKMEVEREVVTGLSFTLPHFYDGLVYAGVPQYAQCAAETQTIRDDCKALKICVIEGTAILKKLPFPPEFLREDPSFAQSVEDLKSGVCNVIAGRSTELSEQDIREQGYSGSYAILPDTSIDAEPFAYIARYNDPLWYDLVNWVVGGSIHAELEGIDQENAALMPTVTLFGTELRDMFRDAMAVSGNYGEIYERNLEIYLPREGLNLLNKSPFGPQHYPWPEVGNNN